MFNGATCNAAAIVGTAVFKIVVSSDSMKNATAISHGSRRLLVSVSESIALPNPKDEGPQDGTSVVLGEVGSFKFCGFGGIVRRIARAPCRFFLATLQHEQFERVGREGVR